MSFSIAPTVGIVSTRVLPRTGPRPLVPAGLLIAALGMVLLTRLGVDTAYATHVLPSLILIGVGFGLTVAPSFATATYGVPARDSGVASAMVNTSQQVGGSIGTALLSTLAAAAATDYVTDLGPAPDVLRQAAVEGYTTAFWWAAAIFAVGALVCGGLLRSGTRPEPPTARRSPRPRIRSGERLAIHATAPAWPDLPASGRDVPARARPASADRLQRSRRLFARLEQREQVTDAGQLEHAARRTGRADDHQIAVLAPQERARAHEHVHAARIEERHVAEIDRERSHALAHRTVQRRGQPRRRADVHLSANQHARRPEHRRRLDRKRRQSVRDRRLSRVAVRAHVLAP